MNEINNLSEQINKYYIDTAWDYKYLWSNKTLAVHFGYYDEVTTRHSAALLKMNEMMAERAAIQNGSRVLDAGCGVGGSSIWLARNKECNVVGINIVDQQLGGATANAKNAHVDDKVSFVKADYGKLPFDTNSFDVFWALESMVHAPQKENVVSEAFRVLKPGGRMVIGEYMLRENPELNEKEQSYLTPWLEGWSMPSLLTSSHYKKLMLSAGFSNVDYIDISTHVYPSLLRLLLLCRLLLPGAVVMQFLGLFTKQRVANIKGSLRQIAAFKKGYWKYIIMVGLK